MTPVLSKTSLLACNIPEKEVVTDYFTHTRRIRFLRLADVVAYMVERNLARIGVHENQND